MFALFKLNNLSSSIKNSHINSLNETISLKYPVLSHQKNLIRKKTFSHFLNDAIRDSIEKRFFNRNKNALLVKRRIFKSLNLLVFHYL